MNSIGGSVLTHYYLDIETLGLDPTKDKIIMIQFQELDSKTGATRGEFTMLKEWLSSEKEILEQFIEKLNPEDVWSFVPVGHNLRFELQFLQVRARKLLDFELTDKWIHYQLPRIDIRDTMILMNEGKFKGTSSDWLVKKQLNNEQIPELYANGEYLQLVQRITDETKRFLHAYRYLKKRLPEIYGEYNPLE
ncbi:MAG: ribonuclease H-like domain-containing protein [Candidatus Thorarchaeota archaeon]